MTRRAVLACVVASLLVSVVPAKSSAQGPDLPPIPRLSGICRLADGPKREWTSYTVRLLNILVSYPSEWSARETPDRRIELASGNRVMVRLWAVDTGGLAPAAWLQRRDPTRTGVRCQVVELRGSNGRQCFDRTTGTWTTFLIVAHRVFAIEASSALSRETHCGVLMSVREGL